MSEMSLDDVLNGDLSQDHTPEVNEPQVEQPETEPTEPTEPERTEPEPVKPETTAGKADNEPTDWQYKAYKDEREKRQERDARIAELERQLADNKSTIPDVFEDQEGFVSQLRSEMSQAQQSMRTELSREFMMSIHDDYEEKEKVFIELAKTTPALAHAIQSASNPAKFAYEQAKKHLQYQEMQDVDAYRAKIKAEILNELKQEQEKAAQDKASKTSNITPSLASERSSSATNDVQYESLDDVMG